MPIIQWKSEDIFASLAKKDDVVLIEEIIEHPVKKELSFGCVQRFRHLCPAPG
jgi:hypothetical protein